MIYKEDLVLRQSAIAAEKASLFPEIFKGTGSTIKLVREFARTENKTFSSLVAYLVVGCLTAHPTDKQIQRFFALTKEEREIDYQLKFSPPLSRPRKKHKLRRRRKS